MKNLILNTDSYKHSHWKQYPNGTEALFSYIEARGSTNKDIDYTIFFGLQDYIVNYLSKPITHDDVNEAKNIIESHGEPFNEQDWRYIVDVHKGYMPVKIMAVPEGEKVKIGNVLVTIESTDPKCAWLESFLETSLLRAVWYPTTVATNSFYCKQLIMDSLRKTSDDPEAEIPFKLHDFGARGASSLETAAIGGMAHLVNFMGTDTVSGIIRAMQTYQSNVCGFSIPAAEHSTMTSYEKEGEYDAYLNMINQYAKPGAIFAVVVDSYDIFNAVEKLWIGGGLLNKVKELGATVVLRPDSGDPRIIPIQIIDLIASKYGYSINSKGYKVLPPEVRVIQGDGITPETIKIILKNLEVAGYSASNIAFGMGAGLLQSVNRDTFKFALKCSAININGEWKDVFKDPITDSGKKSKRGRLGLYKINDDFTTSNLNENYKNELQIVYNKSKDNGCVIITDNFDSIKNRANKYIK